MQIEISPLTLRLDCGASAAMVDSPTKNQDFNHAKVQPVISAHETKNLFQVGCSS